VDVDFMDRLRVLTDEEIPKKDNGGEWENASATALLGTTVDHNDDTVKLYSSRTTLEIIVMSEVEVVL
jgi:hypothetical protein